MPSDNTRITVVNVIAVSYSGATWVNLLLGAHPDAFSVGEIDRAGRTGKWVCTLHGEACPVWSGFDPREDENPLVQIADHVGKRVLVLNNTRRFLKQQRDPRIDSKFIWITRDGRAVLASGMRKTTGRTARQVSRFWARNTKKKRRLIRSRPSADTMQCRYEDVVADTPGWVQKMCELIGLAYEPTMLDYWKADHHYLAGSPGVLSLVAREQGLTQLHALHRDGTISQIDIGQSQQTVVDQGVERNIDLSQYQSAKPDSFKDERWRSQLSEQDLKTFRFWAGRLNVSLGYTSSID